VLTEPFKEMLSIPSAGSLLQGKRAFGGFQKRVESHNVQCPDLRVDVLNSVKCFSSGTIRKCDIRLCVQ
jgi:hypothetical protein